MKLAITNLSVPYHCINFHRNLKQAGYDATLIQGNVGKVDWSMFDVLWNIGNFLSAGNDVLYELIKRKNPRIKIVAHWVGTDILQLKQFVRSRKKCLQCVIEDIDLHCTDNVNFQKELYELGINAEYVTLIPEQPLEMKPLPEKFRVACYVPNERADFYRLITLLDLAKKMPDVDFLYFRTEGQAPLANCQFLGWVKDQWKFELYEACSAALSIPLHGSLGVWVIELLQMGRRAITSEEHPYCLQAESPDHIVRLLSELKDKASPGEEASRYYLEEYGLKHQLELIGEALKKL